MVNADSELTWTMLFNDELLIRAFIVTNYFITKLSDISRISILGFLN